RSSEAAVDTDIAVAKEAFGNQAGNGVGADLVLVPAADSQNEFNAAVGVGYFPGLKRIDVNGIYVADFDAIQAHRRAHTHSFNLGKIRAQTVLWPQDPAGATGDVKDSDRKDDNPHEYEQSDAQLGPAQLFALRHGRPLLDSFLCIVESPSSQKVLQVPIGCVQNGALVALKINAAIAQHHKGRWRHG